MDDDLWGPRSILPYFQRIPEEIGLSFRSRIQNITEDYALRGTTVNTNFVRVYNYNDQ